MLVRILGKGTPPVPRVVYLGVFECKISGLVIPRFTAFFRRQGNQGRYMKCGVARMRRNRLHINELIHWALARGNEFILAFVGVIGVIGSVGGLLGFNPKLRLIGRGIHRTNEKYR